jgi:RNA polymerase sigma-70 factor (sigma-E family)
VITLPRPDDAPLRPHAASVSEMARCSALELLRFAYLLCGDRYRAEDLLQDVLLAMYRRFGDDVPLDNPLAYARRALVNANISRARRALSSEVVLDELGDAAAPERDDAAERDSLWRALRRLPTRQRTVLVLRFYEDATDADIAAVLDCRRGTVRSLVSRALAALRDDPTLDVTALEGGAR